MRVPLRFAGETSPKCQRQRADGARFRGLRECRRRAAPTTTMAASIRKPASSARNCSSFSRFSSGEGGSVDEALQRRAAIRIEPDVMIERPLAIGRGGAGEIQRVQPLRARPASPPPSPHSDWCAPRRFTISAASVPISTAGIVEQIDRGAQVGGFERRQVALHIDHDLHVAVRVGDAPAPRKCGPSPRRDRCGSSARGGRPFPPPPGSARNRSRRSPRRALPHSARSHDVLDHRLAGDIGERLAGQAGRRHPGRNQDQDVASGHAVSPGVVFTATAGPPRSQGAPAYTGCVRAEQTG